MNNKARNKIKRLVVELKKELIEETKSILTGIYGIHKDGHCEEITSLPGVYGNKEMEANRHRLIDLLENWVEAGLEKEQAVGKLIYEASFTHLNQLVAFKMMEAMKLRREIISKGMESSFFKMYLTEDPEAERLWRDGKIEEAYRNFLIAECKKISTEAEVLFDADSVYYILFPRTTCLKKILPIINQEELELSKIWQEIETIGWIYQYFNDEERRAFKASKEEKVPSDLIDTMTQLYTPRWIVEYLVDNTLGRLWLKMHPDSKLLEKNLFRYLVPEPAPSKNENLPKRVREITILDPACGTMHFGLVAFERLYEMYKEEIENAGKEGWPVDPSTQREEDIPVFICKHNLYGIDIDLRSVQLAALALYLKAKTYGRDVKADAMNLVCSDIRAVNGEHVKRFVAETGLQEEVHGKVLLALIKQLKNAHHFGSLLKLDTIESLLGETEKKSEISLNIQPGIPRLEENYWDKVRREIFKEILDVNKKSKERYFAGESKKGLRIFEILTKKYWIIVTNPPYLDARDYNPDLKKFIDSNYPKSKRNLYSSFIEMSLNHVEENGRLGIITPQTFMFITSYTQLREHILDVSALESLLHLGFNAFDDATVDTAAFVLRKESLKNEFSAKKRDEQVGVYFRLLKDEDKKTAFEKALCKLQFSSITFGRVDDRIYLVQQSRFKMIEGWPWVYWIPDEIRELFKKLPALRQIAKPKQGLATADNNRFLRFWWEVGKERIGFSCINRNEAKNSGKRWFPYMKGGDYNKWYGNQEYVVNWENDGFEIRNFRDKSGYLRSRPQNMEYYFQEGVTWTDLSSKGFGVRYLPLGFIFDVKGSSGFPKEDLIYYTLAVMNSSWMAFALGILNPTVSFQVGDISRVPVIIPDDKTLDIINTHVKKCIEIKRSLAEKDETTWDFIAPPALDEKDREDELVALEKQIDDIVFDLYGISEESKRFIMAEISDPSGLSEERKENAKSNISTERLKERSLRWVSYAVGYALGRFRREGIEPIRDGIGVIDEGHENDLPVWVERILMEILREKDALRIVAIGKPLRQYLAGEFFTGYHIPMYKKRPVYWALQSERKNYTIYLFHEHLNSETVYNLQRNYVEPKLALEKNRLSEMVKELAGMPGESQEKRTLEKRIEEQQELVEELTRFRKDMEEVIALDYNPDINDGVLINMAPLHKLIKWSEPEKFWERLLRGELEWSTMAKRLKAKGLVK